MVASTPSNAPTPVLVSGAGFAGLATAYWLNRLGFAVTLVELADGLRKGGTPVDIGGETIAVLTRMGLMAAIRASALPPRHFEFRNVDDRTIGAMAADTTSGKEEYEIHRDDLVEILFGAVAHSIDVVFGRSIVALENRPEAVTVTFDDGSRRDYALVFGCDGTRSRTRRLAFGPSPDYSHFMGGYFVLKVVPKTVLLPANTSQIFSVPGRTAVLNGYADRTDVALAFRTATEMDYDYRDRAEQRRMIHAHFDGLGWKVPAMLDYLDADDDSYFDRVNQIRMPAWSTGRVALVGDAGYCVSPVAGKGGSMAIIGAGRLGQALERHGCDHAAAFRDYHDNLHGFVKEVQHRAVESGMAMMFPADEAELTERDRQLNSGTLSL